MAATEIVSGVSGESEEKIRDVFDQAMVSAVIYGILATGFIIVWNGRYQVSIDPVLCRTGSLLLGL